MSQIIIQQERCETIRHNRSESYWTKYWEAGSKESAQNTDRRFWRILELSGVSGSVWRCVKEQESSCWGWFEYFRPDYVSKKGMSVMECNSPGPSTTWPHHLLTWLGQSALPSCWTNNFPGAWFTCPSCLAWPCEWFCLWHLYSITLSLTVAHLVTCCAIHSHLELMTEHGHTLYAASFPWNIDIQMHVPSHSSWIYDASPVLQHIKHMTICQADD